METSIIKERPILFSGGMVRALLAGTKTQTRRAVKFSKNAAGLDLNFIEKNWVGYKFSTADGRYSDTVRCPYGKVGERLWVRECFASGKLMGEDGYLTDEPFTIYRATDEDVQWYDGADDCPVKTPWKPSIHMPRAASRLLLEITAVRCERLQDISEADAVKEGVESCIADLARFGARARGMKLYRDYERKENSLTDKRGTGYSEAVLSYESLWASINGPESWAANPWVWVVEFKVIGSNPALPTTMEKEVASA